MQMTIRPARRADLAPLQKMITQLAAFHGDKAALNMDALHRDIFGAQPWIHVLVALKGDTFVGYIACCPLMQLQYCARGLDIHHLYVTRHQRQSGVGQALINAAKARAKDMSCGYLMVGTTPDNLAAQAVYAACGFTATPHNPYRFHMTLS